MTEGEIGSDLFFVRSGTLLATIRHGTEEVAVARLGPGDVLGEFAAHCWRAPHRHGRRHRADRDAAPACR